MGSATVQLYYMSLYFYLFLVFSVYSTVLKGVYLLRLLDSFCVQTIEELPLLKVHKREKFFVSDFEFFTIL